VDFARSGVAQKFDQRARGIAAHDGVIHHDHTPALQIVDEGIKFHGDADLA
jgi:hypothetical protein